MERGIVPAMFDFLLISACLSLDIIAYFLATLFIFLIFLVLTSSLRGVVVAHANKVLNAPHYSTISRRINSLEIKINEKLGNDIVIALDSTYIANRAEWMRHKWHVRKGYLKIHVTVDINKKRILSLEVTSEEVHDGKMLKKLVDDAYENNKVKRVLADAMYDTNNNFRYLSKNHIKPGIKTRSNSKVKSTNCHARNMSVIRQQTNLKRWKRSVSYGYRWIAETAFSSIKRTFGEHVTARKFPHMVKEIFLKAALYNMFNRMS
jgi:transposase